MDPRYKSPESSGLTTGLDEFRDLQTHTTLLVWALRLGALISVVAVWSNGMQFEMLGRPFALPEAQANDTRERTVMISTLVVAIANYFVFGRWIVMAHRNLPPLGLPYPEMTPGWAVGWFFVPVANLWKPFQAMRLLWQASVDSKNGHELDTSGLLIVWWSLWIIVGMISSFALTMTGQGGSIEALKSMTLSTLIVSSLRIPQYVIASLLVQKIWEAQAAQRRRQLDGIPVVALHETPAPV